MVFLVSLVSPVFEPFVIFKLIPKGSTYTAAHIVHAGGGTKLPTVLTAMITDFQHTKF